jgi:hypothetical protein
MKIISCFFVVMVLWSQVVIAADKTIPNPVEEEFDKEKVCQISANCKKLCDLKISDDLEKATPEQQKIIMGCTNDMLGKLQKDNKISQFH